MTYKNLLDHLLSLNNCQLDCEVTVNDPDMMEYYPAISIDFTPSVDDVLGPNHPFLVLGS